MIDTLSEVGLAYLPLLFAAAVALAAVAFFAVLVAFRPNRFWPALAAASVLGAGLVVGGLTIADEILISAVVLGALAYLTTARGARSDTDLSSLERLHYIVFALFIVYFIIQAVRGTIEFGEARKLRWVAFFGLLGLVAVLAATNRFPLPSRRQLARTLTVSIVVYFAAYLLWGVVAEAVRGISRFDSSVQTSEWGSTAYTVFPVVLAVPALLYTLRDERRAYRRLAALGLILVLSVAFYYDSRAALLAAVALFLAAVPFIGLKAGISGAVAFAFVLFVFLSSIWPSTRSVNSFVADISASGSSFFATDAELAGRRDVDRTLHFRVAFSAVGDSWTTLAFGYGFRSSGRIISRALYEEYLIYLPATASRVSEDVGTEAFTAILVETGIIGLGLLGANAALSALQVMRSARDRFRYVVLCALALTMLWLVVINILDVMLLYLAIMPRGLLWLLARESDPRGSPEIAAASRAVTTARRRLSP